LIGDLVDLFALIVPSREKRQREAHDISPCDLGLSCQGRRFGHATR
jgi:hypothetical protein